MVATIPQAWFTAFWKEWILPTLIEYIAIPALSPSFDPEWQASGKIDEAVELLRAWADQHAPERTTVEVIQLEGRTPVLLVDVPSLGELDETVLMYGHCDKQPPMDGWRDGLGPWSPVREGDRLYGRGGADDGYALFAAIAAIKALHEHSSNHARCVILIECSEESSSPDLPFYVEHLRDQIGTPSLVVCLDSGAGDYERLWVTSSLRGLAAGTLRVKLLENGVHSGDAGGVIPSTFWIASKLLDRIWSDRGHVHAELLDLQSDPSVIPFEQIHRAATALGDEVWQRFPWLGGAYALRSNPSEAIEARTWGPALEVIGTDYKTLPGLGGGNVHRHETSLRLSVRLPPTVDADLAMEGLRQLLTNNVPYGAHVSFEGGGESGWLAPPTEPWLQTAMDEASQLYFDGNDSVQMGEGGSIPFMGMLSDKFPSAQFMVVGVLGPESNAHGPNEFLHVPYAEGLTACVAHVLEGHFDHHDGDPDGD